MEGRNSGYEVSSALRLSRCPNFFKLARSLLPCCCSSSGFSPLSTGVELADALRTAFHSSLWRSAFKWYNRAGSARRIFTVSSTVCSMAASPALLRLARMNPASLSAAFSARL